MENAFIAKGTKMTFEINPRVFVKERIGSLQSINRDFEWCLGTACESVQKRMDTAQARIRNKRVCRSIILIERPPTTHPMERLPMSKDMTPKDFVKTAKAVGHSTSTVSKIRLICM